LEQYAIRGVHAAISNYSSLKQIKSMKKTFIRFTIMTARYSILLLCIVVTSSSLLSAKDGYSQELDPQKVLLTLTIKNQSLAQVFKDIEKRTDFRFFYNASCSNVDQRVSLHVVRGTLSGVLSRLSSKTGLEFKQINHYFSVRPKSVPRKPLPSLMTGVSDHLPERITVTHLLRNLRKDTLVRGSITDEQGEPLPGVTVQVKGTGAGTVSNANGDFSIEAPENAMLEFSYIGFEEQDIPVGGGSLQVVLSPSAAGLNEVVVVGYGTQTKRDLTSAVSQVSGEEIRQTPTANLQNGLNGKLPGLFSQQRSGQPGSSGADIYIRGVSTFTGSQAPLVLVDNVEYDYDQLALIDPNEIASISILKDAASTAIYGIKGANGVILVTTRRGKTGKPVIHLKTNWGIQTPVHVLKTLNAYQSALLQNEADINDGLTPMFSDEDIALFKSGADPYGHPDVDWYNTLFKRSTLITNNNLDISGGSKRVKYFITLGYQWQNGLVRDIPYKGNDKVASGQTQVNSNFYAKRYKFRSNLDIEATNTLHFQLDIAGTRQAANRPKADFLFPTIFRYDYANPYMMPVYNPDGSFGWGNANRMLPPASANNVAAVYALGGYTRDLNDFMNIHLSGIQKLDDLTPGLSVNADIAYSFTNTATRTLTRYATSIPTYWYNSKDKTYHPRDPTVYTIPPYQLVYDGGTPNRRLNLQGALNYQRSFGVHNVSGLVLFNQTSYTKGVNPPFNFRGYTFRFTYNYKHKYLLEMSGAYNGSDRFITQKQYQLFPAISGGWNLAAEPFFNQALPFIDAFKLRGSYGWVGSDDLGGNNYFYEEVYDRTGSYSFGDYHNDINSIVEGTQGNNDVTWQTERKADVGVDFSLFKGKISGTIDYFNDYRYNILTKRSTIPSYFGVQQGNLPPVNIGKVSNTGFEVELAYPGSIGKVGLNVRGNFSFAKNKILFIDEAPPKYPWEKQTGQSIGMIRQWTWLGFYENQKDIDTSATPAGAVKPGYLKYKDINGDGIVDNDDKAYKGYPNLPNTNIGLTLGVSYGGLTLTVLLQAALNFDIYMGNGNAVPFKTDLQPLHLGRWTPETAATATFPALTTTFNGSYMNPDNRSTFWTTRGDYLRVRSMDLNYDIPKKIVNMVGLAQANVYINGYNLFTWSKFIKRFQFDPETASGTGGYVYPPERILNFGLSLTFK
jgi:TonB-linked SusC/RagA family outer membrane protein